MQPQDPEPEVDLRCRCGLHGRVTVGGDLRGHLERAPWSRSMWVGLVLVVLGAVGTLAAWAAWSSPGRVSALFDINLRDLTAISALQLGSLPGSESGLSSSRGSTGVLIALVLIAIVAATRYAKGRSGLLVGCACGLAAGSIGLVVNACVALRGTLDATRAIDHSLTKIIAATSGLPSLPVLGSVSSIIANQVHRARQHIVSHSITPAVLALAAGGVALLGSLMLLAGTLRRAEATSTDS